MELHDWFFVRKGIGAAPAADADLAHFQQQLTAVAAHTAIVTESVKFSARPTNCFAAPYQVDLLVTDTGLDGASAAMLRNAGMKVVTHNINRVGI